MTNRIKTIVHTIFNLYIIVHFDPFHLKITCCFTSCTWCPTIFHVSRIKNKINSWTRLNLHQQTQIPEIKFELASTKSNTRNQVTTHINKSFIVKWPYKQTCADLARTYINLQDNMELLASTGCIITYLHRNLHKPYHVTLPNWIQVIKHSTIDVLTYPKNN